MSLRPDIADPDSPKPASPLRLLASVKGNILAFVVMIMVIFAFLGVTMVSLFSTSIGSSATANEDRRAFYLAESGLRYGVSEVRAGNFSETLIENLNSTTYLMPPSGRFRVNVFGPWFESPSEQDLSGAGELNLRTGEGEIPDGFLPKIQTASPHLWLVNYDYINPSANRPQAAAIAEITSTTPDTVTAFRASLGDDFVAGRNEQLCLAAMPSAAGQSIVTGGTFDLNLAARDIFPKRDGAFEVRRRSFLYREAVDLGTRIRLDQITPASGEFSGPEMNIQADEPIILTPQNHIVTATGRAGDVSYGGTIDFSTALSNHAKSTPKSRNPDIDWSEEPMLDSVLSKNQPGSNPLFQIDNTNRLLTIGGSGSSLGSVWFNSNRNIGGVRNFCSGQGCFFGRGVRVFFTLEYAGTGDGLMFAMINGNANKNDTASVGGDIAQSELLGYSGDSRLDTSGSLFLDNSGPARGLIPPKIGLEFDTKVNYSSTLESSLKYCDTGSNLNADTRNDPGSNGKDAVQYVFWGNSLLDVPCRRQPYCGGNAACEGDPSYDDNRHDAVGDGTQNWSYSTSGNIESSPAVASDGTIYVGSWDNRLYAINPDGSLRWFFDTGGQVYSPMVSPLGNIYFGSADGNLYSLTPSGNLRWSYPTGGPVRTKPVFGSGLIYFGSDDGHFYALFANGGLAWDFIVGAPIQSSPALSPSGSRVYFGADDGNFYALNSGTGTFAWATTPSPASPFRSSPAVGSDGSIFVGSDNGRIYAFNSTGTIRWNVNTGEGVRSSPAVVGSGSSGTVYVGSYNDYLYALQTDTGAQRWRFRAGNDIQSPVAVDGNNHIYFGSNDDRVYALYADGSEKWRFTTNGDVRGKPLVRDDGTVYAGSFDFRLYAINQYANPKSYKDRLITYNSGNVGGVTVTVDNSNDWLKGAGTKGPWAVRMEVTRDQVQSNGTYAYTLKTWLRQCNNTDCSDVLGTFYEDTRVSYSPTSPVARPAQLEQTINLLPLDHQDFERVIFGFTSQTASGDLQTATIRRFQLSFVRPGDPTITSDSNWP
jgi:outer membrane protein assembly factor BamB